MSNFIGDIGKAVTGVIGGVGNILTGGATSNAQAAAAAADPFASQRGQYQTQLSNLMANPSEVTNTPGYQFDFNQGEQALQRQEAATGNLNSGTADIAAVQYGQNYATSTFNQYEQMLAQLSGANTGNTGAAASSLLSGSNASSAAGSGLLGALLSGGSSLFSGGGGGGNSTSGGPVGYQV